MTQTSTDQDTAAGPSDEFALLADLDPDWSPSDDDWAEFWRLSDAEELEPGDFVASTPDEDRWKMLASREDPTPRPPHEVRLATARRQIERLAKYGDTRNLSIYERELARRDSVRQLDADLAAEESRHVPHPRESRLDLKSLVDPERRPRKWFWQGLIPESDHVSIIAPGGTGKSLLSLSLAVMAVRGAQSFIGRALSLPGDRKVLYVDMENSEDDWAERLVDLGVTQDELDRWGDRFIALGMPPLRGLDTEHGAKQLLELLDEYGITAGDALVLDSTQRLTEGEENSSDVIRRMYSLCSAELKRRGITVIRTDNTGKDTSRGARGSSAKADDVGYSLVLERDEKDESVFSLSSGKHRSKVTEDDKRVVFRRSNDPTTGRLVFEPTTSTYPAKLAEVSALLAQLGVPVSAGQRAAWTAWRKGLEAEAFTPPKWRVTQTVVQAAQKDRQLVDGVSHVVP